MTKVKVTDLDPTGGAEGQIPKIVGGVPAWADDTGGGGGGDPISFVGSKGGSQTTTSATFDFSTIPVQENDYAVLVMSRASGVADIPGWTTVYSGSGSDPSAGIAYGYRLFVKFLADGENSVALTNHSNTAYAIQVFRNVDLTTPFDVTEQIQVFVNDVAQPTPPPITPVSVGAYIVAAGGSHGSFEANDFTSSDLEGFLSQQNEDASFDPLVGIGYIADWQESDGEVVIAQFGGGTTGNVLWCSAASVTLALRPANPGEPCCYTDAPEDGLTYARKDGAWVVATEEAPEDGNQYARIDGGWALVEGGSGGGGGSGLTLIGSVTAVGGETSLSISLSEVPANAKSVRILHSIQAQSGSAGVSLRFNGDASAVYDRYRHYGGNLAGSDQQLSQNKINVFNAFNAATWSTGILELIDPLSSTKIKQGAAQILQPDGTSATNKYVINTGVQWRSTSPITSVDFIPDSGAFAAGSQILLYAVSESGGSGGGGDLELIERLVVDAATASVTLSDIPSTYGSLVLNVLGKATVDGNMLLRMNGDAGANYSFERINRFGNVNSTSATSIDFGSFPSAANLYSATAMTILGYAEAVNTSLTCTNYLPNSVSQHAGGVWKSNDVVNSLTLLASAGSIDAGTVIELYGRKKTPSSGLPRLLHTYDHSVDGTLANFEITGVDAYKEFSVEIYGVTTSVSTGIQVRGSINGGASYYSTVSDHLKMEPSGIGGTGSSVLAYTETAASAARWGILRIFGNEAGINAQSVNERDPVANRILVATTDVLDALQIGANSGNMTGGVIKVYGIPA